MDLALPLLAIALLIAVNGLFVAAEFAIIGVRPSRLEQLVSEGNPRAGAVLHVLRDSGRIDRYIATAQLGITIASLGLGMYAEPVIAHLIEGPLGNAGLTGPIVHTIGFIISLAVITYLHVVVGEMVPKSLALSNSEGMALRLSSLMGLMGRIMHLPVVALNHLGLLVLRLLRVPPPAQYSRAYSPDELELIVSESRAGGMLEEVEQALVANIFDFTERRVVQVMTPRTRMQAVPVEIGEEELLQVVDESHFTRLPVYEGSTDNVLGVLHTKDLVRQQVAGTPFNLRAMLRQVPYVPETLPVDKLLAELRHAHQQLAIVLDEHGGTSGLVTLEDLVEEVMGEVRDEFDEEEEQPVESLGPSSLLVRGDVLLDELSDYVDLGPELEEYDVETVAGLVMTLLGEPGEVGDTVQLGPATLRVEAVNGRAIERVLVEWGTGGAAEEETQE